MGETKKVFSLEQMALLGVGFIGLGTIIGAAAGHFAESKNLMGELSPYMTEYGAYVGASLGIATDILLIYLNRKPQEKDLLNNEL